MNSSSLVLDVLHETLIMAHTDERRIREDNFKTDLTEVRLEGVVWIRLSV